MLDPHPKQIIPNPGKSSGYERNQIYNPNYDCTTSPRLTFVMAMALILPVLRTCGPRQRSIRGPHLYTVVVSVFTFSFRMRTYQENNYCYQKLLKRC